MGSVFSWLRNWADTRSWAQRKKAVVTQLDNLRGRISIAEAEHQTIRDELSRLKKSANDIHRLAARRPKKKTKTGKVVAVYTEREQGLLSNLAYSVRLKEIEERPKAVQLSLLKKTLQQVSQTIANQDAISQVSITLKAVSNTGINIEDSHKQMEKMGNMSTELELMNEGVNDELEEVNAENDTVSHTLGILSGMMPYPEEDMFDASDLRQPQHNDEAAVEVMQYTTDSMGAAASITSSSSSSNDVHEDGLHI